MNKEFISFLNPLAFYLFLLFIILIFLKKHYGKENSIMFSSLHILNQLGKNIRSKSGFLSFVYIFIPISLIIIALARPQLIKQSNISFKKGIDIILAIDVSKSMDIRDFKIGNHTVNRLTAAKRVTRDFIKNRNNDKIGIIAFSGRPYSVSPITLSKSWLLSENGLGRVQIGLVEHGTAIGSAIALSSQKLDANKSKSKIIIILTDGENNSGKLSPLEAAKLAKTLNIKVYTIGIGSYNNFLPQRRNIVEFDEKSLKAIASITGGEYFKAQDTDALKKIFSQIDKMEKTEFKQSYNYEKKELFHLFVILAIIIILFRLIGNTIMWKTYP